MAHSLMLRDGLGVNAVACVVGGSMGGMQALEWTFVGTVPVRAAVVLSTGGRHTPWQIGMSELQRQAIYASDTAAAPPRARMHTHIHTFSPSSGRLCSRRGSCVAVCVLLTCARRSAMTSSQQRLGRPKV